MQRLWWMALWGSTAAAALLVAVLTTRSEVGRERIALALSSLHASSVDLASSLKSHHEAAQIATRAAAPPAFDVEATTRELAQEVHRLTQDRDRLQARLAALEHNVDDITGSIARQAAAAAKAATAAPSAASEPAPVPAAPATTAATPVTTTGPAPVTTAALAAPAAAAAPEAMPATPPEPAVEYGVDLGGGLTPNALRARWAGVRSAHPQYFERMRTLAAMRRMGRPPRLELRLLAGPLKTPAEAAHLCAELGRLRVFCRPTLFKGQSLAER